MKKNLRTAGITATVELKDGTTMPISNIPQKKRKAVRYCMDLRANGGWSSRGIPFTTERFTFPEDIKEVVLTYEPITIPARSERPVPNAT